MSGLLKFFKKGFSKTTDQITSVFQGKKLDAESIEDLEEILYAADFGLETTEEIVEATQNAFRKERSLRGEEISTIGQKILGAHLDGAEGRLPHVEKKPEVICLVGVNGSGKTTTAAKLARMLKDDGKSVLVAAADTFRAAANEQLKAWCERLDVPLVASHQGADAAAVTYDAYDAAVKRGADYLIVDTAGRLHTKKNLMDELTKIRRVLAKQNEDAPHHRWLVVDGSLGTNSIQQAKVFNEMFDLSGMIVTKLDGTSKGGAIVAIFRALGIPVFFVGFGEKPEDLRPFDREDYSMAVFGAED